MRYPEILVREPGPRFSRSPPSVRAPPRCRSTPPDQVEPVHHSQDATPVVADAMWLSPLDGGVMNHHHQSQHTIEIDTRLVTTGAVLTAAGAVIACTGMAVAAFAVLSAGRRMIRDMDVPPSQQAARKWQQAKEASRAGMQAWHSASEARDGSLAR